MENSTHHSQRGRIVRRFIVYATYALFVLLFWPFFQAILFAALFGFALNPLLKKMQDRFPQIQSDHLRVLLLITGLIVVVFGPLLTMTIVFVVKLSKVDYAQLMETDFVKNISLKLGEWMDSADGFLAHFDMQLSSQVDFKTHATNAAQAFLKTIGAALTQIPSFLFQFTIFLVVLYFVLVRRETFRQWFVNLGFFSGAQLRQVATKLQDVCSLVLLSAIVVGAIQASLLSLAWLVTGHPQALVVFIMTFFVSFVPVIGSAATTVVLILLALAQGQYASAIILVVVGMLAGATDNIVRAYMFSSKEESTHPMISFLTIMGAVIMFGVSGIFLGPIIAELAFKIGAILQEDHTPALDYSSSSSSDSSSSSSSS